VYFTYNSQHNCLVMSLTIRLYVKSCFLFLLFYCFYIYSHVYTLLAAPHPPPPPCVPCPTSEQNLFHPLILRFCWRENTKDNKKDTTFLLLWDKDSYTERFIAFVLCTCLLQPTLVHLYQTTSLLPCPLTIVATACLKLLYLFLKLFS
jgi:hypothetical protein